MNTRYLRRSLFGLLVLMSGAAMTPPVVAADGNVPNIPEGDGDAAVPARPPVDRKAAETEARIEALKQQHKDLEFQKRTKQPFTSDRSLRHQLRRNEQLQGWEKGEQRRLEYEQLKREQSR